MPGRVIPEIVIRGGINKTVIPGGINKTVIPGGINKTVIPGAAVAATRDPCREVLRSGENGSRISAAHFPG